MNKQKGLLLGAGASADFGLPLASELTDSLKTFLTKEKLTEIHDNWQKQSISYGYPDREIFLSVANLLADGMSYEDVLGHLEVNYLRQLRAGARNQSRNNDYMHVKLWFIKLVYGALYMDHLKTLHQTRDVFRSYSGISELAKQDYPLWVFSLNHDMVIEMLCAEYHIDLYTGYFDRGKSIPMRDKNNKIIGRIKVREIHPSDIEKTGLNFLHKKGQAINLFKIHGSLNTFLTDNLTNYYEFIPDELVSEKFVEILWNLNQGPSTDLTHSYLHGLIYLDDNDMEQFLDTTILAGAFKYDENSQQVMHKKFIEFFGSYLNYVNELYVIGYSFVDKHINDRLKIWLDFDGNRKLIIVNPNIKSIPAGFGHIVSQITIENIGAYDFFKNLNNPTPASVLPTIT